MALTLAQIRAKLQASDQKSTGNNNFGTGEIFPHWSIDEGSTARIRFLPDSDPSNNYFWIEKRMIKLPFAGIKGDSNSKPVIVQVPCIEMFPGYENKCPILAEVRPWFKDKDPELDALGRKYWSKKSFLFQGFVRENPMKEDKVPENPIRRFIISPQIFNLVKSALMDPDLENLPTDYQSGLDFTVVKTSKGGYADYSTSKWARKESALNADEAEAIEKYGLFNLKDFLPKMPTAEELVIMKEMFDASVDGQAYDADRWSKFFKPAGFQSNNDDASETVVVKSTTVTKPAPVAAKPVTPPVVDDVEDVGYKEPVANNPAPAVAASGSRAEDILALIRNRQKQPTA
jgi:hypothetical protein